jgi:hypothetical protein
MRIWDRNEGRQVINYFNSLDKTGAEVRIPNISGDHLNLRYARQVLEPAPGIEGVVLA